MLSIRPKPRVWEDAMKAIEEARAKLKAGSLEAIVKPVEKTN